MSLSVPTTGVLSKITQRYGSQYLINPKVFDKIFKKLDFKEYSSTLKVLDMYPGPCVQSTMFYNKYQPKQYVLMESRSQFVKLIKSEFPFPSPLERTERDPYHWESFIEIIEKEKLLVPEKQPLTHIHNSFLVVGNVTNRNNESLIMQWFHCIGNRNWLQRFGRVRMLLWVPLSTASKLMAEPKSKLRSKASFCNQGSLY